jgi:HSP20 family molecular chaperone IbpA
MSEKNFTMFETLEKSTIVVLVSGHSKETISVKGESDKERNVNKIHIKAKKPDLSENILEQVDFEFEATIDIASKYDVQKSESTIKNGLLIIDIPVDAERVKELPLK